MKFPAITLLFMPLLLSGCGSQERPTPGTPSHSAMAQSLAEARRGFKTRLLPQQAAREPVPVPPAELFRVVRYESLAGKLAAYLSPSPKDGKKHPAIVWLFGGFSNGIGETAWEDAPPDNDQSASAFRKAGIIMLYPSLRGGNDNPGTREGFFGEVDDVLAAADFLAKQDYVDHKRIYLGGHSTGGTLALLAAEASDRFRATFALGPVEDVAGYGPKSLPFNLLDARERDLRAPGLWLHSIRRPMFVFEGTDEGNVDSLQALERASNNPLVHFHLVKGANHFSLIAPLTRLLANKILLDDGATTNLAFSGPELDRVMAR
jgi:dipeptidyl aminopeptidase/acylaminoacyl peptidase